MDESRLARIRSGGRGLVALVLGVCLWAAPAPGQVYVFTDSQGVVHFTDAPRHAGYRLHYRSLERARVSPRLRSRAWDGLIARVAKSYAVPPGLLKAMIHTESGFDPRAISPKGAQGLMQLMPGTAQAMGIEDPFDPWQNIDGGTRYIRYLIERYEGDTSLALAAYNAGEKAVRRFRGMPPYRETRRYVQKVTRLATRYDADFR